MTAITYSSVRLTFNVGKFRYLNSNGWSLRHTFGKNIAHCPDQLIKNYMFLAELHVGLIMWFEWFMNFYLKGFICHLLHAIKEILRCWSSERESLTEMLSTGCHNGTVANLKFLDYAFIVLCRRSTALPKIRKNINALTPYVENYQLYVVLLFVRIGSFYFNHEKEDASFSTSVFFQCNFLPGSHTFRIVPAIYEIWFVNLFKTHTYHQGDFPDRVEKFPLNYVSLLQKPQRWLQWMQ